MDQPLTPVVNTLSRPFWDAAARGALILPFCTASGRFFWPASPVSPFVTASPVEWRACAGEGTLLSVIVFHRAFHPTFATLPYQVGLVELAVGARLRVYLGSGDNLPRPGDAVRIGFAPPVAGGLPLLTAEACPAGVSEPLESKMFEGD